MSDKSDILHEYDLDKDNFKARRFLENAIKAKLEHELRAMLAAHKSEWLKELVRTYRMKNYGSLKKSQMIDYLYTVLPDPDFVESMMLLTNDGEYLRNIMNQDGSPS